MALYNNKTLTGVDFSREIFFRHTLADCNGVALLILRCVKERLRFRFVLQLTVKIYPYKKEYPLMNQTFMKEKKILPLVISMSLPMVISMAVNALYNIVDSYFVAKMSEKAMTALALVFPVQNLIHAIAVGFGVGHADVFKGFFTGCGSGANGAKLCGAGIFVFRGNYNGNRF